MPADVPAPAEFRRLYFGALPKEFPQYSNGFLGLSLQPTHSREIQHDVTKKLPFRKKSIELVQAEDVLEHVCLESVPGVFDEVFRVLEKGGQFRLSVPDYHCPVLSDRSVYDRHGNVICDTRMGGQVFYDADSGKASVRFSQGGAAHLWFPTYPRVQEAIMRSKLRLCERIEWHQYWSGFDEYVLKEFDEGQMPVMRSPPRDSRAAGRPVSIVVDFFR